MIGLILVTHGKLADEFVHAMEHVVGRQDAVATVCIGPNDDVERRRKDIADAIKVEDDGTGTIILTDLFGGTPSNLAISLMQAGKIEVADGASSVNFADVLLAFGRYHTVEGPRPGLGIDLAGVVTAAMILGPLVAGVITHS